MELLIVVAILGILATMGTGSFMSSQRKSRDNRRKSDLKQLTIALETYFNDKGRYPADDSAGKISVCGPAENQPCEWGEEFADAAGTIYMVKLPQDPAGGYTYFYDGSNQSYQVYARLENTQDGAVQNDSGDPIVFSGIYCSVEQCNYGVSSSNISPETNRTVIVDPDP